MQLAEPRAQSRGRRYPCGADDQGGPLALQAPPDEGEYLQRTAIEPVSVISKEQKRTILRGS